VLHHIGTLIFITIPMYHSQFHWHLACMMLLETNVLLLTIRRSLLVQGSLLYTFTSHVFHASWIFIRLIGCPAMLVFFIQEYKRLSFELDTYINLAALAVLLQTSVVLLSYFWTYGILSYDILWLTPAFFKLTFCSMLSLLLKDLIKKLYQQK
jgi:TLC domain